MFLILPHSAEIRHGRMPWVVTLISMLCVGIYILQDNRYDAITTSLKPYCEGIYDNEFGGEALDFLREDKETCIDYLAAVHDFPDKETFADLIRQWATKWKKSSKEQYTPEEVEAMTGFIMGHYEEVRDGLPPSLDAKLMYDPRIPNPFKAITSALSHADWWHIIGNLIFFFAFAPAVEFIIASPWRFTFSLGAISLIDSLTYSITVFLGAEPLPTLGLSGVVMGVIGMAAYLMPNVRIRTFVWVMWYARNIYVPAAILAVWYIGWDTYDLVTSEWSSGINLVAHVSGGVAGYLIARTWFTQRREETRDEVDDEVEYNRARRNDQLGILSSYKSKAPFLANALREEQANKAFERTLDRIHQAVNTGNDALAINLFLEPYEEYRHAIELYEQMYEEMLKWPPSRALLCLSRLLISEYLASRKYAKAIQVTQRAYAITDDFVFAVRGEGELLTSIALKQGVKLIPS